MDLVLDIVGAAMMLAGAVIAIIAAVGLHTMPDVYARMHVATKPATLGIALCLGGAALRVPTPRPRRSSCWRSSSSSSRCPPPVTCSDAPRTRPARR